LDGFLTLRFFNSRRIRRRRVLFQEKGLTGQSIEKEIVKKMERELDKVVNLTKWLAFIFTSMYAFPVLASQTAAVTVVGVVDGDTCILENGERVRYYGINAPESGDPQFNEATQANNNLVVEKEVRLEPQNPSRDREDRLLAYVF